MDLLNIQLDIPGIIILTLAAVVLALAGGAMAGMALGRKQFGYEVAAMMGALYGPAGTIPGILLGLIVLKYL